MTARTKSYRPSPTALLNPRKDASFKALFTQNTKESNAALADFISAMLGRNVKHVELTTNEPPVDLLDEMQMAFDVSVIFDDGERAAIEMQGANQEYEWESRAEIQCARLLNAGVKKGDEWNTSKVYQMSVLNFTLVKNDKEAFRWYTMKDDKGGELSDLLNVLFLELPKVKKLLKTPPENLTKREKWALFLSYADKEDAQPYLSELFKKEEGLMNAQKSLYNISEDERNWWIQNSIDKARRDHNTALHNAEKRGREEGRAEGRAEGEHNKALDMARLMLANTMPVSDIAKYTGLSEAEVLSLQK